MCYGCLESVPQDGLSLPPSQDHPLHPLNVNWNIDQVAISMATEWNIPTRVVCEERGQIHINLYGDSAHQPALTCGPCPALMLQKHLVATISSVAVLFHCLHCGTEDGSI